MLIKRLNYNQELGYDIFSPGYLLVNQMPLGFFFL